MKAPTRTPAGIEQPSIQPNTHPHPSFLPSSGDQDKRLVLLIDDAPETKHGWLLDQKESNFSTSRGRSHCVKSQAFMTIGGNSGIGSCTPLSGGGTGKANVRPHLSSPYKGEERGEGQDQAHWRLPPHPFLEQREQPFNPTRLPLRRGGAIRNQTRIQGPRTKSSGSLRAAEPELWSR